MFESSAMLYFYVETPLHAGSGSSVGLVDLPIQRERVTHYPLVQATGIKGKLRAEARDKLKSDPQAAEKIRIVFGPDDNSANDHAGAISPSDARLLLFPVRSLVGVFAYTTSRSLLARFKRDLDAAQQSANATWALDNVPDDGSAWTVDNHSVVANKTTVVLEEFSFTARQHNDVGVIADWLANNALPQTSEYAFFRERVKTNFVILPDDDFRDFTQFATEVVARIRIDQESKTVAQGALWTEEHLPSDTLLYAPLHATRPRTDTNLFNDTDNKPSADKIIDFIKALDLNRIQLGGDETVGRGIVKLHIA
jgi:CRISPR-associated protein Cmr4